VIGLTRRGFLQAAAGTLVLRCVLRVSAEEAPRGILSVPRPQYASPMGDGSYLVSWVTEGGMSRVSVVGPDGTRDLARTGSGDGAVLHPQGIARDEEGTAYVCDSRNGRVLTFAEGKAPGAIGRIGFLPGQFHLPQGCAVAGSALAVADTQNHRVQVIDVAGGEVTCVIGRLGDGDAEFRRPSDVAFEDESTLWILDAGPGRAVKHDVEGKRLGSVAVPVGAQGLLCLGGRLFVSDTRGGRVVVIDAKGRVVASQEGLSSPRGLCAGAKGEVVVCESGADRLSVFSLE